MYEPVYSLANDGSASEKLQEWSSLIGITTAIIGNILISFALNIQRYAHIRLGNEQQGEEEAYKQAHRGITGYGTQEQGKIAEQRASANLSAPREDGEFEEAEGMNSSDGFMPRPSIHSRSSSGSTMRQYEKPQAHPDRKSYLRSPYWWAGIVLMIIGEAGNFLAYGFAPASIVSPLGVVALVSNCIIAPCLLHERFRQRDFWGVAVAVAGAVVVVLSAKTSEDKMGPKDLWSAITRWEFEVYLGITAAFIIGLMWASGRCGEKSIVIDLGLVGLFGGYTALSTKGVASLLSYTLWRALTFPITYLLLFVLVASALLQIRYVNRALQRFDSTQVIPTQFVLFTISVIIGSAVLYRDFESATAERVGKFVGGCILTFLGVYLITSGRAKSSDHSDDDEIDDEEGTIGLIDEEASSPTKPLTRHQSSTTTKPRRTSQQMTSGPSSLPHTPRHLSTSSDLAQPLLENPWSSSPTTPTRPRILESTISTPLLPTEAQSPNRPGGRMSPRPYPFSRDSVARLMPGPLLSPLSSPLSALVRDSLRRGADPSKRRPGISRLRGSRSQRSTGDVGSRRASNNNGSESNVNSRSEEGGEVGSSPLKQAQRPGLGGNVDSPKGRAFSVSLGEFFRLKRGKSDDDVEGGSSR